MKQLLVLILGLGMYSPMASAQWGKKIHEVDLNLSQARIWSYKLGDSSRTDIALLGAYSHYLKDGIQLYAEGGFSSWPDGTGLKTLITLMGGATYNFDSDITNSFFAQGAIGLSPAYVKDDGKFDSKMSFFIGGGKRFDLYPNLSYKPSIRLSKRGDMDMDILLQILNMSLFF